MNNEPLISVIIPVYKVEKYLDRCVNSVVNQTYKNLEIILIDDGSPDNCPQICDQWAEKDNRIVVIHKKNEGLSSARNTGLKIAKGKYIGFVDSDDWIELNMYKRLYDILCTYNADMSICDYQFDTYERSVKMKSKEKIKVCGRKECLDSFFRINGEKSHTGVWCYLISDYILKDYNFIDGLNNEDVHASYYFSEKCRRTAITNEIFYHYYKNTDGITLCKFTAKKMDLIKIWDIVSDMVSINSPEYRYACDMNMKRAKFTLLSQMLLNGYDKSDNEMLDIKKQLKKEVRDSFWDLMKWKMPLSRKVLLCIVSLI